MPLKRKTKWLAATGAFLLMAAGLGYFPVAPAGA